MKDNIKYVVKQPHPPPYTENILMRMQHLLNRLSSTVYTCNGIWCRWNYNAAEFATVFPVQYSLQQANCYEMYWEVKYMIIWKGHCEFTKNWRPDFSSPSHQDRTALHATRMQAWRGHRQGPGNSVAGVHGQNAEIFHSLDPLYQRATSPLRCSWEGSCERMFGWWGQSWGWPQECVPRRDPHCGVGGRVSNASFLKAVREEKENTSQWTHGR